MKTPAFLEDLPYASELVSRFSRWRRPTRRQMSGWVRKNGLVAALALFASTVIYLGLQEKITQKTYTVKVNIRAADDAGPRSWWPSQKAGRAGDADASARVFVADPSAVEVTLSGSFSELQLFDGNKLEFVVPGGAVRTDSTGRTHVLLRNRYLKGTSGLNVFKVKPERVFVKSDTRVDRAFQIATPKMEILRPFKGHAEIQVRPNRVTVSGWASRLDSLASSGVMLKLKQPVRVDGSLPSFTQEAEVSPPDAGDGERMTVSPSRVSVTVDIVPDTIERVFSNLTVNVATPAGASFPHGYRLSRRSVAISLVGQEKFLSGLSVNDVGAYVDVPTYTNRPGKMVLPVRIWVQPNVWVSSSKADPETIALTPPPPPPPPPAASSAADAFARTNSAPAASPAGAP